MRCLVCKETKPDVIMRLYEEGDTRAGRPTIKQAPICDKCDAKYPAWKDEHWSSMELVETGPAD